MNSINDNVVALVLVRLRGSEAPVDGRFGYGRPDHQSYPSKIHSATEGPRVGTGSQRDKRPRCRQVGPRCSHIRRSPKRSRGSGQGLGLCQFSQFRCLPVLHSGNNFELLILI